MAYLYASGNYIIGNDDTYDYQFLRSNTVYTYSVDGYTVKDMNGGQQMVILIADVTALFDSSILTTKYTEDALKTFLRNYTGSCTTIACGDSQATNSDGTYVLDIPCGDAGLIPDIEIELVDEALTVICSTFIPAQTSLTVNFDTFCTINTYIEDDYIEDYFI